MGRTRELTDLMTELETATSETMEPDTWPAMLPEILEMISDRLPLANLLAFRHVCRSWRSAPSGRLEVFKFKKDLHWLLFYDVDHNIGDINRRDCDCYMYSPYHPTCCTLRLPDLRGATIVESKHGWFLAHHDGNFFFYNPFSLEKIEFAHHHQAPDQACTFTGPPTSPRCTLYIVSGRGNGEYEMSHRRKNDSKWSRHCFSIKEQDGTGRSIIDIFTCCCMNGHELYDNGGWACYFEKVVQIALKCPEGLRSDYYYHLDMKTCNDSLNMTYIGPSGPESYSEWLDQDYQMRDLAARHGNGWLRKFGERWISISSLSHSYATGRDKGMVSCMFKLDREWIDCSETVKAAWVEPWFEPWLAKKRASDCGDAVKAAWVEPWLALKRAREAHTARSWQGWSLTTIFRHLPDFPLYLLGLIT